MTEPKSGMSKGCLIALIAASIVLVLVVAMSIVCYVKRDTLVEWGVIKMTEAAQKEMLTELPEGYTSDDVNKICEDFRIAIKEKKVDPNELRNIAVMFQEVFKDKKIDKTEGKQLLEEFKKAVNPPEPATTPTQ